MFRPLMAALIALLSVVALSQTGCRGSFYRTGQLDLTTDDIVAQLTKLRGYFISANDSTSANSVDTFLKMYESTNSVIYYADAPGSLGTIDEVFGDLELSSLLSEPGTMGVIQKIYTYFLVADEAEGFRGAILIAGNDGAGGVVSPSPTPTQGFLVKKNLDDGTVDPTPTPVAGTTTPVAAAPEKITFIFAGWNANSVSYAGTSQQISPGTISDGEFNMDLNLKGTMNLSVRSTDVIDGDLSNVIQLEFYKAENGGDSYLGLLNLVAPQ